jgi:hypothetical protein
MSEMTRKNSLLSSQVFIGVHLGEIALFLNLILLKKCTGMELEKFGDPSDPPEGSNFSVICRTVHIPSSSKQTPPHWFHQIKDTGEMQMIDETNPLQGLKSPLHYNYRNSLSIIISL